MNAIRKATKIILKPILITLLALTLVQVANIESSQAAGNKLPTRLPKKIATQESFTGFQVASRNCRVYEAPRRSAKTNLKVSKGKKIWLEPFDVHWSIGYKKSGDAIFIPNFCFKKSIRTASR